ncbi:MAG TPA: hypothetical protein VNO43_01305, partial [Candidatus Eisenbacteria bacterium]|nr:hypothetical protein [Candidatus Eisenbacteria bacterium]
MKRAALGFVLCLCALGATVVAFHLAPARDAVLAQRWGLTELNYVKAERALAALGAASEHRVREEAATPAVTASPE